MPDQGNANLVRTLINNTPVAYIVLDEDYRVHFINEKFLQLRSLNKEDVLGEICYNISNRGEPCRQCAVKQALETGARAFVSRKDILPNGAVRFIDDYAIPLKSAANGKRYVLEIMVDRSRERLVQEQLEADYMKILADLSNLIEAKDSYTRQHSESVRLLSVKMACALGLPAEDIAAISFAASLHDIGKIQVPKSIINKPGKLTDEEFDIIKAHTVTAYEMLSGLANFEMAQQIARHHHERVDGKGYPDGLAGEEIPLGARIVAVADTYDAITSARSYKQAFSHEYALEEIARVAGTQLDQAMVDVFVHMDFDLDVDAERCKPAETMPVERAINPLDSSQPERLLSDDFLNELDEDQLLHEILNNTPCGYAFMDTTRQVWFASNYFLDYMGLREEDVLGKTCYPMGQKQYQPCGDCAVVKALASGNVEFSRQERDYQDGKRIFDLFGVPLKNDHNTIENVIQIVIDRTQEVLADRERTQVYDKLADMLGELLSINSDAAEDKLSAEIMALQGRLQALRQKKA